MRIFIGGESTNIFGGNPLYNLLNTHDAVSKAQFKQNLEDRYRLGMKV